MEHTRVERNPTIRPSVLIAATVSSVILGALVWRSRGPAPWEQPLIVFLRHEPPPLAHPLLLMWQPLPLTLAILWLTRTAAKSHRTLLAVSGAIGCALAIGLTELVLKPLVGRHHLYAGSAVFPSAHVAAAAAFAMFAWLVMDPRSQLRSWLGAVPVVVGWAAISTGAHYPADAIAGLFVGGVVVYCTVLAAERLATTAGPTIDLSTGDIELPSTHAAVRG